MDSTKYIALIDCDSFFCSCECKFSPELSGKALSVVSGDRGCVISRSREAKLMGVRMGEPLFMAKERCPDCIYINADHTKYLVVSKQIMSILKDFSPNVEVYSIDEAFVDLTGLKKLYKMNYYDMAKYLRTKIMNEVGMPVSIGVSRSKTLAKLASDRAKNTDSHILLLGNAKIEKYLKEVQTDEIWGIGSRLSKRFMEFGIRYAYQFVKQDDDWVRKNFGIVGLTTKHELCGVSVLSLNNVPELPKSISDTKSFPEFTSDINYLKKELQGHIHKVCKKLRRVNLKCKKVVLILKTKDFKVYYKEFNLQTATNFELDISKIAFELLQTVYSCKILYRSIGILLDDFINAETEQLNLFDDNVQKIKSDKLGKAIDKLEHKFGRNAVRIGLADDSALNKQDFITSPKITD